MTAAGGRVCDGVCDANSASRLLIIVCSRSQNSEVSLESCVALHVTPPLPSYQAGVPTHTVYLLSSEYVWLYDRQDPSSLQGGWTVRIAGKNPAGQHTGSIVLNSSLLGRGLAPTQSRSGSKLPEVLSSVVAG